ncbi:MAG: non-hydrolyzing UDP-N-acetylglucosamine 2-epimerase [Gaiellaceae bacterium]
MPTIVHVVGARPNYMKIAPVHEALAAQRAYEQVLVHTGQHYDVVLKDVFFDELALPLPDIELDIGPGSHAEQTAAVLLGVERVLHDIRPAAIVVAGDVNSTLGAALAAVKLEIPVVHVEAGLRSFDWSMPEEHNRRLVDHVSTLLLTHSESADENLRAEGIVGDRVQRVGNTMVDTLLAHLASAERRASWLDRGLERGSYLLVTLHRPALVDSPSLLERTIAALGELAREMPVVFPAHPRTRAHLEEFGIALPPGLLLLEPLPYIDFLSLEVGARAIVTDSGGIQEEATALGVRCFTLRANTERPVTVSEGTNVLLGLEPERLVEIAALSAAPDSPRARPPLWDGHAGERAAAAISRMLSDGADLPGASTVSEQG